MRDVAHHRCEQAAERAVLDRLLERGMADAGADAEPAVLDPDAVELADAVDVDQMLRPRQPERHGRHQALPAGQHAAVVVGVAGEQVQRFRDGLGGVVLERGGLHCAESIGRATLRFNAMANTCGMRGWRSRAAFR